MSEEQKFVQQILAAKTGSEQALTEVISYFRPLIFALKRKLHYSDAQADLILSLVKIIYRLPAKLFADKEQAYQRVLAYIQVSLKNEEMHLAKIQQSLIIQTIELEPEFCDPASMDWVTRSDLRLTLAPALKRLTQQQRQVIHLRYFIGSTDQEISCALGISRQAVYKLRRRALATLKAQMGK